MALQISSGVRRLTGVVVLWSTLGCYVYAAPSGAARPGQQVELFLSDRGRRELGATVGAATRSVAGRVAESSDSAVTLFVTETRSIRGDLDQWNRERVPIPTALLDSTKVQHLSIPRSAIAGGTLLAVAALVRAAFSHVSSGKDPGIPKPAPQ